MEGKSGEENVFMEKSKKYVAKIEQYCGNDPLDPWYRYLVWLEENYVIDFKDESFFTYILCRCVSTFESDERYKQDRRMVKLFIKYISCQHKPEDHYNLMHSNGVGTCVADLYICWAHQFNIVADYERAEQVYLLGFKANARPFDLLDRAHKAFGVNMSKRVLNEAKPGYEIEMRKTLHEKYIEFIGLHLDATEPTKREGRVALQEFDRVERYAIPFYRAEQNQKPPSTPERQSTTSLKQTVVNSRSARKKAMQSQRSLHETTANRLDFCVGEDAMIPLTDAENMYARGIQLPKNFVRTNLPQRMISVRVVRDDDLASSESDLLQIPAYDKIMLLPAVDKSYSPEELMAYKWFKRKTIENKFTAEMDALWSVGWHVPFRRGEWFVSRNLPQRDEVQQEDYIIDGPIAEGIWRFAFDIEQYHPKNGAEISLEELLWLKRKESSTATVRKPSSILHTINQHKLQLVQQEVDRFDASTSQQGARRTECPPMCISAESKIEDFSRNVPEVKQKRCETPGAKLPRRKMARKLSIEFDELDEMCMTQSFGMCLQTHAVSMPNSKTERTPTSQTAVVDANEAKPSNVLPPPKVPFEIFTDGSMSYVNGDADQAIQIQGNIEDEAAGFQFEIYRDQTDVMSELIRVNAEQKSVSTPPMITVTHVNDENRPSKHPRPPYPCKSKAYENEPPLKEQYVRVPMAENNQQLTSMPVLDFTIPLSDYERNTILKKSMTVNFSLELDSSKVPKFIEKSPSIVHEDVDVCNDDVENDLHGQSIYVTREEVIFSDAKHADWLEVTQHLAKGAAAKNDYEPEKVDMNETLQMIDTQLLNLMKLSPFDPELQKALLDSVLFLDRLAKMDKNVCEMIKIVRPMKPKAKLTMGKRTFIIHKMIGSGNFGNVFCGECCRTKSMFAFKQERPPNVWEYYICLEVQKRLENKRIRDACMLIEHAMIGNNATIFASKFSPFGTLLNVCNKVKQSTGRNMDEYVVMILAKQMFTVIDGLHRANIIHGDLKPDNFLLMNPLDYDYDAANLALQLIDFGQSIDMKLFPKNQRFYSQVKTENFICTEMMDSRPWTFQLDLFCLASTIYTMVCGHYMVVSKTSKNSTTYKTQTIPRYYNKKLWTHLFDVLINIPDPRRMPNLAGLIQLLDDEIQAIGAIAMRQKITKFNRALAN